MIKKEEKLDAKKILIDLLKDNEKIGDLVKKAKPKDVVSAFNKSFDIVKKEIGGASNWGSGGGIETNKQYPVPPIKKNTKYKFLQRKVDPVKGFGPFSRGKESMEEVVGGFGYWLNRRTGNFFDVKHTEHWQYLMKNLSAFGIDPNITDSEELEKKVYANWIRISGVRNNLTVDVYQPFTGRDIQQLQDFFMENNIQRLYSIKTIYLAITSPSSGRMIKDGSIPFDEFMQASKPRDLRFFESKKRKKEKLEEGPGQPMGKSDMTPRFTVKRWHFPPDPISEPPDWPYTDSNIAGMDLRNKTKKGITS